MAVYRFDLPLPEVKIRKLKVRDVLYLNGTIVTARDQAHRRALEYFRRGRPLPATLEGLAVFHCGPLVKKEKSRWNIVAAGPTTSTRMEPVEEKFLKNSKARIIIGKGGMGKRTTKAMKEYGAVYGVFTGGAGVLAANTIKKVEKVEWMDLGEPEAMWFLEVENFGPLAVAIDSHGNNLFRGVQQKVEKNKSIIYRKMG